MNEGGKLLNASKRKQKADLAVSLTELFASGFLNM